jgi:long-subunit fatty acid transport protein
MKTPALGAVLLVLVGAAGVRASDGEKPVAFSGVAGGRGGVDYAYAEDATAAITNPAGLAFVNDRIDWDSAFLLSLGHFENDLGRENLSPSWVTAPLYQLGAVIDPTVSPRLGDLFSDNWGLTKDNRPDDFGGIIHLGFGIFTDQGASFTFNHIETAYFAPASVPYRGQETTISIAPTFAIRITDNFSFGYTPAFRYSTILLDSPIQQPNLGLTPSFQSVIPQVMTYATSHNLQNYGFSQRFGIKFKSEFFSAGLVYQDRGYTSDYKGQIVQDSSAGINRLPAAAQSALAQITNPALGYSSKYDARVENLESPREIGGGIQISPMDRFSIGLDYTNIMWEEFRRSLQVRLTNPRNPNFLVITGPTAEVHVPLDWSDQSVIAAGIQGTLIQGDDIVPGFPSFKLILRAGYNWAQSPLPRNTLNPALPLILEHHASVGFTVALGPYIELSNAVIHGFSSLYKTGADHADSDLSFSRTELQDWAVITQLSLKF